MDWILHGHITQADISGLAIAAESRFYAATRDGALIGGTWGDGNRILAHVDGPLLYLVYAPERSAVCAVGNAGAVLVWREGDVHEEHIGSGLRLTGACVADGDEWALAGQVDARSGVLLQGVPGAWREVTPGKHPQGLECIAPLATMDFLIAGQRGYVGVWSAAELRQVRSGTEHPLRAVSVSLDGTFLVGGGGWAEEMPILLAGDATGLRPLASAGGNRVIVGISRAAGDVWLCENRSDGQSWSGMISRLKDGNIEVAHHFPGQRLHGIAAHEATLAVWGPGGFLASTRLS
jgi:hypothetical protein